MKRANHNRRTLDLLESEGWTVEKVEHWQEFKRYIKAHELEMLDNLERAARAAASDTTPGAGARRVMRIYPATLMQLTDLVRALTKPGAGVRKDLFGFGDFLGCRWRQAGVSLHGEAGSLPSAHDDGIRIFQVCRRSDMSTRRNKILAAKACIPWLRSGGTIELMGWYKDGRLWQVKREKVTA